MSPPQSTGVIFDFDGLILDTETPGYDAWCEEYARHGQVFDLAGYREEIGTHFGAERPDPAQQLVEVLGGRLEAAAVRTRRHRRFLTLVESQVPLPGVVALLETAHRRGVPVAVASSSPRVWVEGHLARLGLARYVRTGVGRDDVGGVPKPSPRVYQLAFRRLAVCAAVALEDSGPGLQAAGAAGLPTVVVPNEMTVGADFAGAARVLGSLEEVCLDDLLALAREGVSAEPG